MTWFRSLSGRTMGVIATTVAAAGLIAMVVLPRPSPWLLPVLLAAGLGTIWLLGRYWGRIDEAAREAQKSAWFWGGSAGMGLGLGLLLPPQKVWIIPADVPIDLLPALGGAIVAGGGILGFLVAWAAWWLRHR